jgi:hypothetical protein
MDCIDQKRGETRGASLWEAALGPSGTPPTKSAGTAGHSLGLCRIERRMAKHGPTRENTNRTNPVFYISYKVVSVGFLYVEKKKERKKERKKEEKMSCETTRPHPFALAYPIIRHARAAKGIMQVFRAENSSQRFQKAFFAKVAQRGELLSLGLIL